MDMKYVMIEVLKNIIVNYAHALTEKNPIWDSFPMYENEHGKKTILIGSIYPYPDHFGIFKNGNGEYHLGHVGINLGGFQNDQGEKELPSWRNLGNSVVLTKIVLPNRWKELLS